MENEINLSLIIIINSKIYLYFEEQMKIMVEKITISRYSRYAPKNIRDPIAGYIMGDIIQIILFFDRIDIRYRVLFCDSPDLRFVMISVKAQ